MSSQQTFEATTFYVISDQLKSTLEKRIEAYSRALQIFGVLTEHESTSDEDIHVADAVTRLVGMYTNNLSSDFPSKFRQCICCVKEQRHYEIAPTGSAQMMFQMLYTAVVYRAFPKTEVGLRIYLSLMATNCWGNVLFPNWKEIKMSNQWWRKRGVQGMQAHPQKVWICWKSGQNPWKCWQ